jgi:hypothetical protein
VFDAVLVAGDETAGDAAVVQVLVAGVVEQVRTAIPTPEPGYRA